jgi:hypothetical protein
LKEQTLGHTNLVGERFSLWGTGRINPTTVSGYAALFDRLLACPVLLRRVTVTAGGRNRTCGTIADGEKTGKQASAKGVFICQGFSFTSASGTIVLSDSLQAVQLEQPPLQGD